MSLLCLVKCISSKNTTYICFSPPSWCILFTGTTYTPERFIVQKIRYVALAGCISISALRKTIHSTVTANLAIVLSLSRNNGCSMSLTVDHVHCGAILQSIKV